MALNLGFARIGDADAAQVARALEDNATITHMNLKYNNIGAEGTTQVARALEASTTLTRLDLAGT